MRNNLNSVHYAYPRMSNKPDSITPARICSTPRTKIPPGPRVDRGGCKRSIRYMDILILIQKKISFRRSRPKPIRSINSPDMKQVILNSTVKLASLDIKQNEKTIKPINKYAISVTFHNNLIILNSPYTLL